MQHLKTDDRNVLRRLTDGATVPRGPTTVVEATGEPASFALIGSQRGKGNAGPGKIMETIL